MRLVVADTSPLRYLLQIDQVHLLPQLFEKIFIPSVVCDELRHASAPRDALARLRTTNFRRREELTGYDPESGLIRRLTLRTRDRRSFSRLASIVAVACAATSANRLKSHHYTKSRGAARNVSVLL